MANTVSVNLLTIILLHVMADSFWSVAITSGANYLPTIVPGHEKEQAQIIRMLSLTSPIILADSGHTLGSYDEHIAFHDSHTTTRQSSIPSGEDQHKDQMLNSNPIQSKNPNSAPLSEHDARANDTFVVSTEGICRVAVWYRRQCRIRNGVPKFFDDEKGVEYCPGMMSMKVGRPVCGSDSKLYS